ncbi:sulfatase-like hydrolase/transferase [Aquimarina pacifica]|uniref:sulfatase-like hydrolase/transferase n=1 Tax=Aquimarina pacifica TaxID=1296415 RepID=UPI0004716EB3|nr:sulfatase-like hydrolase/transferase [Aquimarina pacifica]
MSKLLMQCTVCVFMFLLIHACSSSDQEINTDNDTETETDPEPDPDINASPNVMLIIADDMGLDASPGYGIGNIKPNMPNLQNMINSGVIFNNVWSNPTCTPTRAGIITGKYGFRTGVTKVGDQLSTTETSLQQYIDNNVASPYNHAVIGKWHISNEPTHPNTMGVDYYAGLLTGSLSSYYDWNITINGATETSTEYNTTQLTDLAIDWVNNQSTPWFLWLSYNAAHTPFHLPPDELHSQGTLSNDDASIDANPIPYYMAMLEAMDSEFGRLLDTMSDTEKENTVFIFVGDNGTPRKVVQEYIGSKGKGTVYQGGINVPMIISGKNVLRKGSTEEALINTTDLFATIADIVGINSVEINDSKSFKNLLSTTDDTIKREFVFTEIGNDDGGADYAIRNTTHKYILFDDDTEALYNLSEDPFEELNLMDQIPISDLDATMLEELTTELSTIQN